MLGGVLGGVAMWMTQAIWRRTARAGALESIRWGGDADRLVRMDNGQIVSCEHACVAPEKQPRHAASLAVAP